MIEDVIAALPSIERLEIEEKLRAVSQHKPDAPPKPAQTKAPADLSMSWEEIPLPPRIVATSGAPKFVLGRNTHGNIQQKAVSGPGPAKEVLPAPTVLPLIPSVHTAGAGSYVPSGLTAPNAAPPPSAGVRVWSGPSTSKPKPFLNTSSYKPSPLFPSSAPRNARHSIDDQSISHSRKGTLFEEPHIDDSSPQGGTIPQFAPETRSDDEDRRPIRPAEPSSVAEFSESVFIGHHAAHGPHTRETVEPALPGAFRVEREASHLESGAFAHSPPTPPTRLRPTKSRRTARTSVPGGFDDVVASGEEDNVPPLPEVSSVKRSTRRRGSRASSVDAEEDSAPVKPRRSSRLSAASSSPDPDPSPQKISAPKATRKTRATAGSSATTGVATATRSSTRKKR